MSKIKVILFFYFLICHFFIALVLVKTDILPRILARFGVEQQGQELTLKYYRMLAFHKRVDGNIADDSVIFIGDSLIQGLAVSAIYPKSVNFGIGFDTSIGVLNRIPHYKSLKHAKAVVISIGFNDLDRRTNKEIIQNHLKIIELIPNTTLIIFSSILPVDEGITKEMGLNVRINEINRKLQTLVEDQPTIQFLDMTPYLINSENALSNNYHIGDGVHLNNKGNSIWITQLKAIIRKGGRA